MGWHFGLRLGTLSLGHRMTDTLSPRSGAGFIFVLFYLHSLASDWVPQH